MRMLIRPRRIVANAVSHGNEPKGPDPFVCLGRGSTRHCSRPREELPVSLPGLREATGSATSRPSVLTSSARSSPVCTRPTPEARLQSRSVSPNLNSRRQAITTWASGPPLDDLACSRPPPAAHRQVALLLDTL